MVICDRISKIALNRKRLTIRAKSDTEAIAKHNPKSNHALHQLTHTIEHFGSALVQKLIENLLGEF